MAKELFKEGATVEVSFEDEGFKGSWYTAYAHIPRKLKRRTIITSTSSSTPSLPTTKALSASASSLTSFWSTLFPPRESYRTVRFAEEVDAFHNDSWWQGIITSVVVLDDDSTAYSVFFRSSREQLEFRGSELRLHREWIYGEWCPPLE